MIKSVQIPLLLLFFISACASDNSEGNPPVSNTSSITPATGANTIPLHIGGLSVCSQNYPNEPCATVTVCVPNTTNCQTITDILVDTGSVGLRVFASTFKNFSTSLFTPVMNGSNPVAECAEFGTGSDWGPVVTASVTLGSEPAVTTPIQLIEYSYASARPSGCSSADQTPSGAGYNGILGVGLTLQDCGSACATLANNDMYYSCPGNASCTSATTPLASQLQNPVALLPTDNNGVIVELPLPSSNNVASITGSLVFGIGTQSNNSPSGATLYGADNYGNFTTSFNGASYSISFIDSGSNGLFFPDPTNLPLCTEATGFFCPTSTTSFSATDTSASNSSTQVSVNFSIDNAQTLLTTGNSGLPTLGANLSGVFDWGLPFFYGRKVYVGFTNQNSSLGTGPYWAF